MDRRKFLLNTITASTALTLTGCGKKTQNFKVENNKLIEKEKSIEFNNDYDVIVCGAGPAGIGAAIGAAKDGQKVLLIESGGCLGGTWTRGLLSWIFDF